MGYHQDHMNFPYNSDPRPCGIDWNKTKSEFRLFFKLDLSRRFYFFIKWAVLFDNLNVR